MFFFSSLFLVEGATILPIHDGRTRIELRHEIAMFHKCQATNKDQEVNQSDLFFVP